jgi:hypothetical protein
MWQSTGHEFRAWVVKNDHKKGMKTILIFRRIRVKILKLSQISRTLKSWIKF